MVKSVLCNGKDNGCKIGKCTGIGNYYLCKFFQSDLDMYFVCDNSKCKDYKRKYPYYTLLEMYSSYAPFDCFECREKMIITLDKAMNYDWANLSSECKSNKCEKNKVEKMGIMELIDN